jgi:hypothetical protein
MLPVECIDIGPLKPRYVYSETLAPARKLWVNLEKARELTTQISKRPRGRRILIQIGQDERVESMLAEQGT